jgi:hypothetical protein
LGISVGLGLALLFGSGAHWKQLLPLVAGLLDDFIGIALDEL